MLSILAIFSWWYQGKVVTVDQEESNNDLLPLNFGRDFQLPDRPTTVFGLNIDPLNEHRSRSQLGIGRRRQGIVQRVPVPRLNRLNRKHPNRHRSAKCQSWNPGLPVNNQYIGQIIQELRQIQQNYHFNNLADPYQLDHTLQGPYNNPIIPVNPNQLEPFQIMPL